jgi:hypothetical protein
MFRSLYCAILAVFISALTLFGQAGVRSCSAFAGTTASARIAACIADLPNTGGVADAREFEGEQAISSNLFAGVTKPVTLLLGAATFNISVTQVISGDNIFVIGMGGSGRLSHAAAGTSFKWTGNSGGTVFKFVPAEGSQSIFRVGLSGVAITGGGTALEVRSVKQGIFRDLTIKSPTVYGIDVCTIQGGPGKDSQNNEFLNVEIDTSVSDGEGIRLQGNDVDGGLGGNASYNVFRNLNLSGLNSPDIHITDGDNNVFYDVRAFHAGAGMSIVLEMTEANGFTNNNIFYHLAPGTSGNPGGFEQKNNATLNQLYEYDRSQGAPAPQITSGVLLYTESLLNGVTPPAWKLPVNLTLGDGSVSGGQLLAKLGSDNPGYRAENTNNKYAAGYEMLDPNGNFIGSLTYRGAMNALYPNTVLLTTDNSHGIVLATNFTQRVFLPAAGGAVVGTTIGTNARDGFLYIPNMAGAPTAVPTTQGTTTPIVFDNAGQRFFVHNNGAWYHYNANKALPIFANNAEALAGGLQVGDFYRSGGDPDPVYVVH